MRSPRPPGRVAGLVVLTAVLLSGCGAAEDERVSTSPVVQPGRPGEPAEVLPPGTTFGPSEDPYTEADALFLVQMIPHHAQALEMAELAAGRAEHPDVVGTASRIADVQGAEMDVYRRWLADHGMAEDGSEGSGGSHSGMEGMDMDGMSMDDMPGMASDDDLSALATSSGPEFDRRWLELMVAHHQGALEMAAERDRTGGTNLRVSELAADVVVEQQDEIDRMQGLLAEI